MIVMVYTNTDNFDRFTREFSSCFPYLQIEQLSVSEPKHKDIQNNYKISLSTPKLNFPKKVFKEGFLQIREDMPVYQLIELFHKNFGIKLRVMRKSGNNWISINLTNDWTLKRQNDQGQELKNFRKESLSFKQPRKG